MDSLNFKFHSRKATHCFGAGREHFERVYNTANLKPDRVNPGPGTYTDKTRNIAVQACKWSLPARNLYMDSSSLAIKRGVPSPVSYGDP